MPGKAVRQALLRAGFTSDGVLALLGGDAFAALGRGQTVPARHRLAREPGSAVADLVRLLLLAEPVPAARAGAALPLAEAVALGLIRREPGTGGLVRALTQLQPYPVPSGTVYSPPTSRPVWLPGRGRWRPIT